MTRPDLAAARAFHPELAAALKKVPPYSHTASSADKAAREAALDALVDLISGNGGRVRRDWQGASIRVCGLRASSTGGLVNACENWIRQLTLKCMAEY